MEESIADRYYELLKHSTNKIAVLVNFLKDVVDFDVPDTIYPFIGRLFKIYGANVVFHAILALVNSNKQFSAIDSSFYSYLGAICKNIFDEQHTKNIEIDLTKTVRQLRRRLKHAE